MKGGPSGDMKALVDGMDALSLDPKTEQWLAAKENQAYSKEEIQLFVKSLPQYEEQKAIEQFATFLKQQDREIGKFLDSEHYLLNTVLKDNKRLRVYVKQMLNRLRQNDCSEKEPSEASMLEDQYCLNAINMAIIASQLSFGKSKLVLEHCTRLPRVFLLSDQFKDYREDIEHLELSSYVVGALPEEIDQLINLEHLCVHGCSLKALPQGLCKLAQLKTLDVSKNSIEQIPDDIDALRNLQQLNCASNKIKSLPESFWALKALEHLDLSSNQLCMLSSEISKLYQLKTFNISFNNLEQLPAHICELEQLCELSAMQNRLKTLPVEPGKLQALRKLNIASNQLASLESIMPLTELTCLDVSRNKLDQKQIMLIRFDLKKLQKYRHFENRPDQDKKAQPSVLGLDDVVDLRGSSLQICLGSSLRLQDNSAIGQGMPTLGDSVDEVAHPPAVVHQYESFKPLKTSDDGHEKPSGLPQKPKKKKDSSCIIN